MSFRYLAIIFTLAGDAYGYLTLDFRRTVFNRHRVCKITILILSRIWLSSTLSIGNIVERWSPLKRFTLAHCACATASILASQRLIDCVRFLVISYLADATAAAAIAVADLRACVLVF